MSGKREAPKSERKAKGIRTFGVEEGIGMTESEARKFLVESRFVAKLGTVDHNGDPNIHPVWYLFDPKSSKLYVFTEKTMRKFRNIKRKHRIYFDVDDVVWPYRGVKGKGIARAVRGEKDTVMLVDKILTKYIKKRNHPIFSGHLDGARKGEYVVIEITPMYFSTWDYGKLPLQYRVAALK